MKKLFFIAAALFAALTIHAEMVSVDLSNPSVILDRGTATFSYAENVLTVNWEVTDTWGAAGIELPLNNLMDIHSISFEYIGDGAVIGLIPYVRDIDGIRWWDAASWSSLEVTEWTPVTVVPNTDLWDGPQHGYGDKAFNKLGFIANPENPTSGVFQLRNITITYGETAPPAGSDTLRYNGEILPRISAFTREQCGTVGNINVDEVSGIACSRTTPGYIWMESDNYGTHIVATTEQGQQKVMQVNLNTNGYGIRYWDWEDLCGGIYDGKNYLFIGAFGDNNEEDDFYSIVYFEEPVITEGGETTITPSQIQFQYPDGRSHNCEALMYDNVEQMLYIITKVYYDVCKVYSLPMSLTYGDAPQTLTHVCDLGVRSDIGFNEKGVQCLGFHLVTAADISPDGKYILIKNHNNITGYAEYSWVLYWERQEGESVADAVKRQPSVLDCYEYEWQGEAICWLDDDVFYTTSDSDMGSNPPIYKYTRVQGWGVQNIASEKERKVVMIDHILYVQTPKGLYTVDGRKVQ